MKKLYALDFTIKTLVLVLLLLLCYSKTSAQLPCSSRDFGHGSVVCVCNATYCDSLPPFSLKSLKKGKFYHVVSTKGGKRFENSIKPFLSDFPIENLSTIQIFVNRSIQDQTILGFGGAFTDAACINIKSLSPQLQDIISNQYFGNSGLQYNLGRVPMAGTDFSTRKYSYDDTENDTTLAQFSLAHEDLEYKIPAIHKALELNPRLKLIGSPWSAPKWMKTNHAFIGRGFLKQAHYQTWANYFVKFLTHYTAHNISFWGVTTQNEPQDGKIPGFFFNCMGWNAEQQKDWIKNNLGPTLVSSNFSDVKIIIFDDQRITLASWAKTVLSDPEAAKYVAGVGIHWYWNGIFGPSSQDLVHKEFPNYFLLGTEACAGSSPLESSVILGSWERAESYAFDIIENLNHYMSGWIDWNLALDMQGGPNWAENFVDSPMIADKDLDQVYKQPMYYALGHFSKFIPPDSKKIECVSNSVESSNVQILCTLRPDGAVTVNMMNRNEVAHQIHIHDSKSGTLKVNLEPRSINTVVYL